MRSAGCSVLLTMTAADANVWGSKSTFVFLHGAGSTSWNWYWHLVAPALSTSGHEALAVDFPVDDDTCGLADYATVAIEVTGSSTGIILVAQSMAAYTAPLIATRVPVELIVLVLRRWCRHRLRPRASGGPPPVSPMPPAASPSRRAATRTSRSIPSRRSSTTSIRRWRSRPAAT
jgi:pimeloyl-ACP methyl ester carboxylesterase